MSEVPEDVREGMRKEIRRRFRRLRGRIREWVGYSEDIFGLAEDGSAAASQSDLPDDAPDVYRFQTDSAKVGAFLVWYQQRLQEDIFEPLTHGRVRRGDHWTAQYLRQAFARAWRQSRSRLQSEGVSVGSLPGDGDTDLIEALFDMPAPRRALQEVYTRTYDNLQSIDEDAVEPVRETLLEGIDEGWNPKKTARKLTKEVETLQKTRAETLAQTETVSAYSEATIERYRRAGVDSVAHGVWSDANDSRVCPICKRLDGREIPLSDINEATFTFEPNEDEPDYLAGEYPVRPPAHPRGRCTLIPSVD